MSNLSSRLGRVSVRVVNTLEHGTEIGNALGLYHTLVNIQVDGVVNGGLPISYAWIQEQMEKPVCCVVDWNRSPQQEYCSWFIFGPVKLRTLSRYMHRLKRFGLVEIVKEKPLAEKPPIPEGLRWQVFERDDFRCIKCGVRSHLRADHIVAQSLGGATTLDNLQTLCEHCNCEKGARI